MSLLISDFHVISYTFLTYDNQETDVTQILSQTGVAIPHLLKVFLQDWTWIQPADRQFLYANGSCQV